MTNRFLTVVSVVAVLAMTSPSFAGDNADRTRPAPDMMMTTMPVDPALVKGAITPQKQGEIKDKIQGMRQGRSGEIREKIQAANPDGIDEIKDKVQQLRQGGGVSKEDIREKVEASLNKGNTIANIKERLEGIGIGLDALLVEGPLKSRLQKGFNAFKANTSDQEAIAELVSALEEAKTALKDSDFKPKIKLKIGKTLGQAIWVLNNVFADDAAE